MSKYVIWPVLGVDLVYLGDSDAWSHTFAGRVVSAHLEVHFVCKKFS